MTFHCGYNVSHDYDLIEYVSKFPFQSQTANILCKENTYLTPVINQGLANPILRLQNTEHCPEQNAPEAFQDRTNICMNKERNTIITSTRGRSRN